MNSLQIARDIGEACTYLERYGWKLSVGRYNFFQKSVCILSAIKLKSMDYNLEISLCDSENIEKTNLLADDELLKAYPGIPRIRDAIGIMLIIGTIGNGKIYGPDDLSGEQIEWLKVATALKEIGEFDKIALLLNT